MEEDLKIIVEDYLVNECAFSMYITISNDWFVEGIVNGEIPECELLYFLDEDELKELKSIIRDYKLNEILK